MGRWQLKWIFSVWRAIPLQCSAISRRAQGWLAALTGRRLAKAVYAVPTLRVVWAWRVRCVQIQKDVVLTQCDRFRMHLAKVQRTAQTVRDHSQRVIALAVFE